ncbi:MAG: DUF4397 domain-containing protein [Myxococcota bacterium]
MRVRESACAAALLLGTALVGCDGTDCGSGTADEDGVCVAQCGAGTVLSGGECVSADVVCGPGTELLGNECSVAESACTAPAMFDMETQRCVSPAEVSCGAGTELDGDTCILACEFEFELRAPDDSRCNQAARIQFFNASPDPALETIDVYSGDTRIVDDLSFGEATEVIKVVGFEDLVFVSGSSQDSSNPIATVPALTLELLERYFIVLRGVQEPGDFVAASGNNIELEASIYSDLRESDISTDDTLWSLVHAVPDLGPVSVGRQDTYAARAVTEVFENVSYADVGMLSYSDTRRFDTGSIESGTSALDVYANGGGVPAVSVQTSSGETIPASSGLPAGTIGVLVAVGFANPSMNGDGPRAQVIAVLPDGTSTPLDEAARLQVVHASLDAPSSVDVYLGAMGATTVTDSTEIAPGLAYQDATPFRSFVAGLPLMVQVTEAGSNTPAVNEPFTPEFGQTARLVAVGDPGDGSLTVDVIDGSERSRTAGTIDLQMYHASTNGPTAVEVYLTLDGDARNLNRPPDIQSLQFANAADPVVATGLIEISLSTDGATSLANLDVTLGDSTTTVGEQAFGAVTGNGIPAAALELLIVDPSGAVDVNGT